MKAFNILTHPILLSISFSFIIISGDKFNWFYLLGLLMGLTEMHAHSLIGVVSMLLILILPNVTTSETSKKVLNAIGAIGMLLSLFLFFINDERHYNWETFSEPSSIATLILFGVLWLLFMLRQAAGSILPKQKKDKIVLN